jgi:hypothetical protein
MLVRTDNRGINHHVFIVAIRSQVSENTFQNTTLTPAPQPLVDNFPIAKPRWKITPWDTGTVAIQNGLNEKPVVRSSAADVALSTRQEILDPVPLVVAQSVTCHRKSPQTKKASYESLIHRFGNPLTDDTP